MAFEGWWLLGVCLCSVNLPPAHLQVLLFCPSDVERRFFFSLPKADIAPAAALLLTEVTTYFGSWAHSPQDPPSPKASALPKPSRMNLYCAMCSVIQRKSEGAKLPENFSSFLLHVCPEPGWAGGSRWFGPEQRSQSCSPLRPLRCAGSLASVGCKGVFQANFFPFKLQLQFWA